MRRAGRQVFSDWRHGLLVLTWSNLPCISRKYKMVGFKGIPFETTPTLMLAITVPVCFHHFSMQVGVCLLSQCFFFKQCEQSGFYFSLPRKCTVMNKWSKAQPFGYCLPTHELNSLLLNYLKEFILCDKLGGKTWCSPNCV